MSIKQLRSLQHWCFNSQCHSIPSCIPKTTQTRRRFAHNKAREPVGKSEGKTSNNPYPYPTHRNPTPHQIFHLPRGATEADIKARYYDLVRLYHPDKMGVALAESSPSSEAMADEAHERFQAITSAYDLLRGKTPANGGPRSPGGNAATEGRYQTTAAYRTMQRRRQELYSSGAVDDSKLDKLLIAGVVATIFIVILNTFTTRKEAIAGAVSRSRAMSGQTHSKDQRPREVEERLSMDAVERVNKPS